MFNLFILKVCFFYSLDEKDKNFNLVCGFFFL